MALVPGDDRRKLGDILRSVRPPVPVDRGRPAAALLVSLVACTLVGDARVADLAFAE